jgi:hypothetical protein
MIAAADEAESHRAGEYTSASSPRFAVAWIAQRNRCVHGSHLSACRLLRANRSVSEWIFVFLDAPRNYVYYLVGSAGDAATDSLVTTAVVALSQVCLLRAYPPAVMPGLPMVQGIALGMLLVAFWRLFCQLHTPFQNPQQRPEFRVFSSALRINVMFFVASVASLMAGIEAVQDTGHIRNVLLGVLFLATIFVMLIFKKNVMGSLLW